MLPLLLFLLNTLENRVKWYTSLRALNASHHYTRRILDITLSDTACALSFGSRFFETMRIDTQSLWYYFFFPSSAWLSSQELSDKQVYEPWIRATTTPAESLTSPGAIPHMHSHLNQKKSQQWELIPDRFSINSSSPLLEYSRQ